ncbi:MAG: tRNA (adenosine(37)-N6)-threonylcarbamoyltransferase complex transferase subunit TsaD [Chloroflexi bacterium]|nr:tRNA (adenosine(37)-N6)-threonylcarbamoyltransferase complex transferase subunit TsaD [Chloroflexota bacterium]
MNYILAIESSCDETAAAVLKDGKELLSNIVATQIDIHKTYGGVVPEAASRAHLLSVRPVIEQAMQQAGINYQDLSAVAVTYGPGLAGSLLVGVNAAKGLAAGLGKPLIGVNHIEGHIYANWLLETEPLFPALCLIVSGGHTDLVLIKDHGLYQRLGGTLDDAAGEAFDKASRVLGLPYPGGPSIEKAAQNGKAFLKLPRAWLKNTYNFSFSGLKSAIVRAVQDGDIVNAQDGAASFQEAVCDVLIKKTLDAAQRYQVKNILLAGGVAANKALRHGFTNQSSVVVFRPPIKLCTDNAAFIAAAAYQKYLKEQFADNSLDVCPNLKLI